MMFLLFRHGDLGSLLRHQVSSTLAVTRATPLASLIYQQIMGNAKYPLKSSIRIVAVSLEAVIEVNSVPALKDY